MELLANNDYDFWVILNSGKSLESLNASLVVVADFAQLSNSDSLLNSSFLAQLNQLLPVAFPKINKATGFQPLGDQKLLGLISSHKLILIQASRLEKLISVYKIELIDCVAIPISVLPGNICKAGFITSSANPVCRYEVVRKELSTPAKVTIFPPYKIPKALSSKDLWEESNEADIAVRELIPFNQSLLADKNVFLARVFAGLDLSILLSARSVWVAGKKSWGKLKASGVRINGSTDALGESSLNNPLIKSLFPGDWVKLTHSDSLTSRNFKTSGLDIPFFAETIPYYKISYNSQGESIDNKTHFFWKSGSRFMRAKEIQPKIVQYFHSSGIGSTAEIILSQIPVQNFQPFLNSSDWKNSIL